MGIKAFFDEDKVQTTNNQIVLLPSEPDDPVIAQVLQSKLNAIANGYIEFGSVDITSDDDSGLGSFSTETVKRIFRIWRNGQVFQIILMLPGGQEMIHQHWTSSHQREWICLKSQSLQSTFLSLTKHSLVINQPIRKHRSLSQSSSQRS